MDVFSRLPVIGVLAVCLSLAFSAGAMTLDECKQKASAGDAEAMWQLGQRYENGNGCRKDSLKALAQYKKAAEKKHKKACERLFELYENGSVVKRDPVLAAKYKAWSEGGNGALAESEARAELEKAVVDEIELALDYILGRNGKSKDPKTGIRILYDAAKDKPAAQQVFVRRWGQGDLDDALSVLNDEEWEHLTPWFKSAYDAGMKSAGQILGLDARAKGRYHDAAKYFRAAALTGSARSWMLYAKLYDEGRDVRDGGGPKTMQSDATAKDALEKALRIAPDFDEARYMMGLICAHSAKKKCRDYLRARSIFKTFYDKDTNNKWYCWNYGFSGLMNVCSVSYDNWQQAKSDLLVHSYAPMVRQAKYNRYLNLKDACLRAADTWLPLIRYAASSGCEPAQKFLKSWEEES